MSCRDKSLYVPKGVGCADCEITKDGVLEALGYSASESTQTLPDGQGEVDRLIIGKPLDRYPTSLTITTPPDKTFYQSGEFFDPTGMVVTIGYSDGTTAVAEHYEVTVDTPLTEIGSNTYTVTVSELGLTVTASSTVTVTLAKTVERTLNGVVTLIINEDPASEASHEASYGPITRNHGAIEGIDAVNVARKADGYDPIYPWSPSIKYVISDYPCEMQVFDCMFKGYTVLEDVELTNVTFTGDSGVEMFMGCEALTMVTFHSEYDPHYGTSVPDTNKMVDTAYMFYGCESIGYIDVTLSICESVSHMFDGCTMLNSLIVRGLGVAYTSTSSAHDLDIRETALDGIGLRLLIADIGIVPNMYSMPVLRWTAVQLHEYIVETGDTSLSEITSRRWTESTI